MRDFMNIIHESTGRQMELAPDGSNDDQVMSFFGDADGKLVVRWVAEKNGCIVTTYNGDRTLFVPEGAPGQDMCPMYNEEDVRDWLYQCHYLNPEGR